MKGRQWETGWIGRLGTRLEKIMTIIETREGTIRLPDSLGTRRPMPETDVARPLACTHSEERTFNCNEDEVAYLYATFHRG